MLIQCVTRWAECSRLSFRRVVTAEVRARDLENEAHLVKRRPPHAPITRRLVLAAPNVRRVHRVLPTSVLARLHAAEARFGDADDPDDDLGAVVAPRPAR